MKGTVSWLVILALPFQNTLVMGCNPNSGEAGGSRRISGISSPTNLAKNWILEHFGPRAKPTTVKPELFTERFKLFCEDDPKVNFCEDPLQYPDDVILKAVAVKGKELQLTNLFDHLGKDLDEEIFQEEDSRHRSMLPDMDNNSTVLVEGSEPGRNPEPTAKQQMLRNLCYATTSYIKPRAAKNWKGEWRYIVNSPKNHSEYTQLVGITKCSSPDKPCRENLGSYITACKQEYTQHMLVVLGPDGTSIIIDTFSFPSCCSCHIVNSLEL